MRRVIPILGWLVLGCSVGCALFRDAPDDALTASLKAAGVYRLVIGGGVVVLGLILLWLAWTLRGIVRTARALERFRSRR